MNATIFFTMDEAIKMLKDLGLEVNEVDTKIPFENPHGDGQYFETYPIWMVTNPYTGLNEQVAYFFKKYIASKKNAVFLNPEKLEVYNLFSR